MNNSATLSVAQIRKLGLLLGELKPLAEDFLNAQFFPSPKFSMENIIHFFFFVTGIDHRTSPPNQSFEGIVDGKYFQGADLLWHLSLRQFNENPSVFHPSNMAEITAQQVTKWYSVFQPTPVTIRNPDERAELLRNAGRLLLTKYNGSVLALLAAAKHHVASDSKTGSPGLLKLLSEFRAYEDPANKKSFLFLKFLLRRNLWSIRNQNSVRIPVDNHLTRIALRIGIVMVSPTLAHSLRGRLPLSREMDIELREKCAEAYLYVGKQANRSVLELDDFLWHFGRQCCLIGNPVCITGCTTECFVVEKLLKVSCQGRCPLGSVCLAESNEIQRALVEPKIETWYY